MPTNLPPEAKNKWEEVEATNNPKEKLRLLQEFLSLIPQHHGTSRLAVQVKKQITRLQTQIDEKKHKKAARTAPRILLEREGAAQIALIGMTNVGKSSLLSALTNAKVTVSPNPYTTREPTPGILHYQDVQFQIVETPALMERATSGKAWRSKTLATARNADGIMIVVDLSRDPVGQLSTILNELETAQIAVERPKARVEVDRKSAGVGMRVLVFGNLVDCTFRNIEELLKEYHITDALVKVYGEATLEEIENAVYESKVYRPAIIVANKMDTNNADNNLKKLKAYNNERLPLISTSCETGSGLDALGSALFGMMNITRVYTKEPNEREYSRRPFILKKGATVYDLAKSIHSDFSQNFNFARVWAKRLSHSPQKVGLQFVLEDGDIIEIHLKQ